MHRNLLASCLFLFTESVKKVTPGRPIPIQSDVGARGRPRERKQGGNGSRIGRSFSESPVRTPNHETESVPREGARVRKKKKAKKTKQKGKKKRIGSADALAAKELGGNDVEHQEIVGNTIPESERRERTASEDFYNLLASGQSLRMENT